MSWQDIPVLKSQDQPITSSAKGGWASIPLQSTQPAQTLSTALAAKPTGGDALAKSGFGANSTMSKVTGAIKEGLIAPIKGLGNEIAAGAAGILPKNWTGVSSIEAAQKTHAQTLTNLVNAIKSKQSAKQDTSKLTAELQEEMKNAPSQFADLYPAVNDSAEQVVGNVAGTALNIAGAGELETAAGAATDATKALSTGQRVLQGAKTGAVLGGAQGLASGMSQNQGAGGLAASTATGATIGGVAGGTLQGALGAKPVVQDITDKNLEDIVSPKLDSKETKVALDEGRITRGTTDITGKKSPDIVAPSEDTTNIKQVVKENIPGWEKMNDVQLYDALDKGVTEKAEQLKPEMEATPVKQETKTKLSDDWKALKKDQSDSAAFQDKKPGNNRWQQQFDRRLTLLQSNPDPNMNDVWEARVNYDSSIPANVKNATEASSPEIWERKQMWLQNRALLNNVINDTESGLGETSQKAFSDMSSMYDGQHNISQKIRVETKPSLTLKGEILRRVGKGAIGYTAGSITNALTGNKVGGQATDIGAAVAGAALAP